MSHAPRIAALVALGLAALLVCTGAQSSSFDLDQPAIFVMNADGTHTAQRNVTNDGLASVNPDWSPHGDEIVYSKSAVDHVGSIWAIDVDGGNRRSVLDDGRRSDQPAWSPDASKIAFQHVPDGSWQRHIAVMDADGSNVRELTSGTDDDISPAWSPDGTRIAFASSADGLDGYGIFVISASGGARVRLTTNPTSDYTPAWSPDGTRIAFVRRTYPPPGGAQVDLMVMNADGTGAVALLDDHDYDATPAWSPDGTKIAFASTGGIYSIHPDGTHLLQLTVAGQYADWAPSWSPDGERIAFTRRDYVPLTPPPPPPPPGRPPPPPPPGPPSAKHCHVARVIRLRLATARTKIRRAGCTVGPVRRAHSRRIGRVIAQAPHAGRVLPRRAKVRLVIGRR